MKETKLNTTNLTAIKTAPESLQRELPNHNGKHLAFFSPFKDK